MSSGECVPTAWGRGRGNPPTHPHTLDWLITATGMGLGCRPNTALLESSKQFPVSPRVLPPLADVARISSSATNLCGTQDMWGGLSAPQL